MSHQFLVCHVEQPWAMEAQIDGIPANISSIQHFAGSRQVNKCILQKRKWRKCRAVYLHHYAPAMSSPCWFRRKARSLAPLQTWTSIENVKKIIEDAEHRAAANGQRWVQ